VEAEKLKGWTFSASVHQKKSWALANLLDEAQKR
jgi:hypothetical protein